MNVMITLQFYTALGGLMLHKFIALFLSTTFFACAADTYWETHKKGILKEHQKIEGWCKQEKAEKLMDFIHDVKPKLCIEIGVYAGSSVFPIAKALKYEKKGVLFAIDPWNRDESLKYEKDPANILCWGNVDYDKVYKNFCSMLKENDIDSCCKVMRTTSEKALTQFSDGTVDFIHIDGNHNEEACIKDVKMSLQKLKKGGYLLFDDADWWQTQKTVAYLKENCNMEPKYSVNNECLMFIKK